MHVIVYPESTPVEIQIRTTSQHEWAELFEKLADRVGREIRYGKPPENVLASTVDGNDPVGATESATLAVEFAEALSEVIDSAEELERFGPLEPERYDRLNELLVRMRLTNDWFA